MKPLLVSMLALAFPIAALAAALEEPEPDGLLVIIGVPEALDGEVRDAVEATLGSVPGTHRIVTLAELERGGTSLPGGGGRTVALGAGACEQLASSARPVTCALLSAEAFAAIPCSDRCDTLRAVVMDQPIARQIAVASAVYPSLRRFAVLSAEPVPGTVTPPDGTVIDYRRFHSGEPLQSQLDATLAAGDALLALPESSIFNRSSLHVVLLTAYGHAKPVVGFGRAYVRAGALISAYSTPEQVIREVLGQDAAAPSSGARRVRSPARFSVAENRRIARSLGLIRRVDIDPTRAYSDADFAS